MTSNYGRGFGPEPEPLGGVRRANLGLVDTHDRQVQVRNSATQAEPGFVAQGPIHARNYCTILGLTTESGVRLLKERTPGVGSRPSASKSYQVMLEILSPKPLL